MANRELSAGALRRIKLLFPRGDRAEAAALLFKWPEGFHEWDRCCFAALNLSNGDLASLSKAVSLGCNDYRNLLRVADFRDPEDHKHWIPAKAAFSWKWLIIALVLLIVFVILVLWSVVHYLLSWFAPRGGPGGAREDGY